MKKNHNTVVKFFPFALLRLESLTAFLNEMYRKGYKVTGIGCGCILCFKRVSVKSGMKYAVLSEYNYRNLRRKKWDDEAFLVKNAQSFHKGNGKQFEVSSYSAAENYKIYLTAELREDDIEALKNYRKISFSRINFTRILFYVFFAFIAAFTVFGIFSVVR